MKYYIVYEDYTELTQFEGEWDMRLEEFYSFDKANKWIKEAKENDNIRGIIGPLVKSSLINKIKACN